MHPDCDHGNMLFERCPYSKWCYGGYTDVKIRKRMFKNFPGIEEAWQAGLEAAGD